MIVGENCRAVHSDPNVVQSHALLGQDAADLGQRRSVIRVDVRLARHIEARAGGIDGQIAECLKAPSEADVGSLLLRCRIDDADARAAEHHE